jgi:hypothetical protein
MEHLSDDESAVTPRWYEWKEIALLVGGKVEQDNRGLRTDYSARTFNRMMRRLRLFQTRKWRFAK